MKRTFFVIFSMLLTLSACKQTKSNEASGDETTPASALTQLDVERLIDSLDLSMDISQLSVADLRILRNVFAARMGFPFRDSYLRSVYQTTTWYDSLMWAFDGNSDYFNFIEDDYNTPWREQYYNAIKPNVFVFTPEQQAFINRVKTREGELLKDNFKAGKGNLVNIRNIVNPGLLKDVDKALWQQLSRNGFAIVPAQHQQLFQVYEQNDYHQFPSFVTTDLYLQLYHLYFDAVLRDVEEHKFYPLLNQFCLGTQKKVSRLNVSDDEGQQIKKWLDTYFTVAIALSLEKEPVGDEVALHEYRQVMKSENNLSEFLGYKDAPFEYSLFRPRGHYTRTDTLKRYFRSMMWLQTVPFQTDKPKDMEKAYLLALIIGSDNQLSDLYKRLTKPLDWLMGQPDDVSVMQAWEIIDKHDVDVAGLTKQVNALAEKQTRLRPKHLRTSRNKVRLMPQRYQPDAEVLQEMVDYDSPETKRGVPTGLDVFAAMGVSQAEKILVEELGEPDRWDGYKPAMKRMKQRMDSVNWNDNVPNVWLSALKMLNDKESKAPYFMQTPMWAKKNLNAALASWAELKHDAILYAKQPMGAECGGGGPPDPVVKAYVEPNVRFWKRALELLQSTEALFNTYQLATDRSKRITTDIMEMVEFLLRMSNVELAGNQPTDSEYDHLKAIGATFENMSLELLRNPNQELWEWDAVQGPERCVALIADVYTANADNNPQKCVLFEGVGKADEIYVVVEVGGYLHLMRGGVFSYREVKRPCGEQRMNDEEWQQKLEKEPRIGVPAWMQEITVPLKEAPVDNEEVFYSSGC